MTPASTPRLVLVSVAGIAVTVGIAITIAAELADEHVAAPREPPVLELVGNRAVTTAEVRAAIAAAESPFVDPSGEIDPDAVDREALLVSAYYWDHGYANVALGTPWFDAARNAITIPVTEGPTFSIASVAVTGELLGDEASQLAMIRVRPGMLFSRTIIATDRERLATFYEDRSYAYANVVPVTKVDPEKHTIALTFEIERGVRASFERIDVVGATLDREREIRGVLAVAAGQPYSSTRLEESKRHVRALGFPDVAVSIKRGSGDALVIATIEVSE